MAIFNHNAFNVYFYVIIVSLLSYYVVIMWDVSTVDKGRLPFNEFTV